MENTETENHPLPPFLPENAEILILGSFPPPRRRWSMDFFYPNFNNDFWRIAGLIYFGDKNHFIVNNEKKFDCGKIKAFCQNVGIALFDTATTVIRHKANAADKDLEIVEKTDLQLLLQRLPKCRKVACTGEKAATAFAEFFELEEIPKVGQSTTFLVNEREICFFRMPSTSRAFPAPLEKKAECYRLIFSNQYNRFSPKHL